MAPNIKVVPALSANTADIPNAAPPAAFPVAPLAAASIPSDFHYLLCQILAPAYIETFKVVVVTVGTIVAKAAVEVFVEKVKACFTKERSIEGFKITPPVGTT